MIAELIGVKKPSLLLFLFFVFAISKGYPNKNPLAILGLSTGKRKSTKNANFVRNPEEEYVELCNMNPLVPRTNPTTTSTAGANNSTGTGSKSFINNTASTYIKKTAPSTSTTTAAASAVHEDSATRALSSSINGFSPMHMTFTWKDSNLIEFVGIQIALVSGVSHDLKNNIRLTISADGTGLNFECAWPSTMQDSSMMLAACAEHTANERTQGVMAVEYEKQVQQLRVRIDGTKKQQLGSPALINLPFEVERKIKGIYPTRCIETQSELIYVIMQRVQEIESDEESVLVMKVVDKYDRNKFNGKQENKKQKYFY